MATLALAPPGAQAKEYRLYYLGGQSNMDGLGMVAELPADLLGVMPGVMIFHGGTSEDREPVNGRGLWTELRPGHGFMFNSDGLTNTYSERFGVELTFARRLQELWPDANIAIIKYSRGGTAIDAQTGARLGAWEPDYEGGEGAGRGVNQYDHFLATVRHAMAVRDLDGDGEDDTLVPAGIVWMQGESDGSYTEEVARQYEANLKRLMNLVRAAFRVDDLPVVIGRISDSGQAEDGKVWDYGEIIREAQAMFVEHDGHASLVRSTDEYAYSDPWHYDTAGYVDLGKRFAEAMLALIAREQE